MSKLLKKDRIFSFWRESLHRKYQKFIGGWQNAERNEHWTHGTLIQIINDGYTLNSYFSAYTTLECGTYGCIFETHYKDFYILTLSYWRSEWLRHPIRERLILPISYFSFPFTQPLKNLSKFLMKQILYGTWFWPGIVKLNLAENVSEVITTYLTYSYNTLCNWTKTIRSSLKPSVCISWINDIKLFDVIINTHTSYG